MFAVWEIDGWKVPPIGQIMLKREFGEGGAAVIISYSDAKVVCICEVIQRISLLLLMNTVISNAS